MGIISAKFTVGQLIQHKLFNYRGVIVDVDPNFQGSEEWYNQIALTRPPKNAPWYRVLVHNAVHETYVAERNLEPDDLIEPINHPLVDEFFETFENGHYITQHRQN
jgi:heat shock protein HspQ